MKTTETKPSIDDLISLGRRIQEESTMLVAWLLTLRDESPETYLDPKAVDRVARLGEVAHRHLEFIETNGSMTLGDSLAIRRELYGTNVQATANLFGRKGSGALLVRDVPAGTARDDGQPVEMTAEGIRIAELWRESHGLST